MSTEETINNTQDLLSTLDLENNKDDLTAAVIQHIVKPDKYMYGKVAEDNNFKPYVLPDTKTLTWENILDEIFKADVNRCTIGVRDENGEWTNKNADILLDKQNPAESGIDDIQDFAPRPLFHTVCEEKLRLPTYKKFLNLLDNYDATVNAVEFLSYNEMLEIDQFLNAILKSYCMKLAYNYITEVLGFDFTYKEFKLQLYKLWFEVHKLKQINELTNDNTSNDDKKKVEAQYCSGFEHVYMGEITIHEGEDIGHVIGFHNWIKFYIDEIIHKIDYLGTRFSKNSHSKYDVPFICVKFKWVEDGRTYVKDRGSFYVGNSPECSIAAATICFYETQTVEQALKNGWEYRNGKFKSRRIIDGYKYDFYLCREENYLVSCFQELTGITEEKQQELKQQKLITAPKVDIIKTKKVNNKPKEEKVEKAPDIAWQNFSKYEINRLKILDPNLSDKEAYKLAQEAWEKKGNSKINKRPKSIQPPRTPQEEEETKAFIQAVQRK